jgi:hypothetical protein
MFVPFGTKVRAFRNPDVALGYMGKASPELVTLLRR